MLRVQLFERGQEWVERLGAMQRRIGQRREKLIRELQLLDAEWNDKAGNPSAGAPLLSKLEAIHRLFSFYTRWSSQIQEALVQLTL